MRFISVWKLKMPPREFTEDGGICDGANLFSRVTLSSYNYEWWEVDWGYYNFTQQGKESGRIFNAIRTMRINI